MSLDAYIDLKRAAQPGAPLIFAFHGTGADERQFFDFAQELLPEAGVIAPRGDVSEMGAARFFRRSGMGVYDMEDLARAVEKLAGYVAAHKETSPGAPIYGFGYSNGANILAALVMDHPDLFDRIGLLHPLIPWDPAPQPRLAGKNVLITAGMQDPITPWSESEKLMGWFQAQGAQLKKLVHPGGHEIRSEEIEALAQLLRA